MYLLLDDPRRDLAARMEAEFVEDVDDVPLGGRGRDDQLVADLAIGEPARDQQRDLALARGEATADRGRRDRRAWLPAGRTLPARTRRQVPSPSGAERSGCSSNSMPEPATRSRTVLETSTSPVCA